MAKSDSDSNGLRQDQPEWFPSYEGGLAGWSSTMCRGHHHCVVRSWYSLPTVLPNGWHRTTKANIRFHLYGGPQGWNPHGFGLGRCTFVGLRPSVRAWSSCDPRGDRVRVCAGVEPSHGRGVSFAFFRSGLEHLRASSRFERASAIRDALACSGSPSGTRFERALEVWRPGRPGAPRVFLRMAG